MRNSGKIPFVSCYAAVALDRVGITSDFSSVYETEALLREELNCFSESGFDNENPLMDAALKFYNKQDWREYAETVSTRVKDIVRDTRTGIEMILDEFKEFRTGNKERKNGAAEVLKEFCLVLASSYGRSSPTSYRRLALAA